MSVAQRTKVVISDVEAGKWIKDGMTISVGGIIITSHPMAIIRQIIKNRVKNLTVVQPNSGLDMDLLIGAGCVKKVISSYVGGENLAPIGPCFRMFAEKDMIEIYEIDEYTHNQALTATAMGLPFLPWKGGVGTSLPDVNPALKLFRDPIKGELLLAVPAIEPDIAILHAAYADCYGAVQHIGTGYQDKLQHRAADKTIVQVEQIVPNERIRCEPVKTTIYGADAIVRAPHGAHPYASPGFNLEDNEHLREYVDAAETWRRNGDKSKFDAYLEKYIYEPEDHAAYLERIGFRRIISLAEY